MVPNIPYFVNTAIPWGLATLASKALGFGVPASAGKPCEASRARIISTRWQQGTLYRLKPGLQTLAEPRPPSL